MLAYTMNSICEKSTEFTILAQLKVKSSVNHIANQTEPGFEFKPASLQAILLSQ